MPTAIERFMPLTFSIILGIWRAYPTALRASSCERPVDSGPNKTQSHCWIESTVCGLCALKGDQSENWTRSTSSVMSGTEPRHQVSANGGEKTSGTIRRAAAKTYFGGNKG